MRFLGIGLLWAILYWTGPAAAQMQPPTTRLTPDAVAHPATPVPRVSYRSVFADTPTGVEDGRTDWSRANAEAGRMLRGHMDILRWEAGQRPAAPPTTGPGGKP